MWPFNLTPTTEHPEAPPSACPIDSSTREAWSNKELNSTVKKQQSFQPNRLSKDREVSSIPRWINPSHPNTFPDDIPATACPARSAPVASTSTLNSDSSNSIPSSSNITTTSIPSSVAAVKEENWVYPSPSSFYSALERKDRDPQATDMPIVVPIHNAVNERVWEQVLEWEKEAIIASNNGKELEGKVSSKLVSFIGKPKELSPRARFKGWIGYTAPFDRHDWIVDRPIPVSSTSDNSTTSIDPNAPLPSIRIRYIIDFYTGRALPSSLLDISDRAEGIGAGREDNFRPNLAFYIDTRPALDSWEGFRMRGERFWKGIVG